ncbi:hypothetical protein J7E91_24200 [Streptomyces sp. ISL-99]|uniref:type II toxin-antitoxin system CcdA family antitoxin n=1 Tax=Streptomyces sp. ISL-99 TaxID=2819193 RepID=UPI001BE72472|nr:type II toxin-antitoxin system CcdA family antitoxin [Streptomyces sp. ISL-99]MBT2528427.1 hypothetical protein [Streptomyces sp. ISL-99]
MADTARVTITLPAKQVEALKQITDNVSGYVAEAVARQLRREFVAQELARYQEEYGAFTEEELAQAEAEIFGTSKPNDTEAKAA